MDKDDRFLEVFKYRFSKNWALRNILTNYFVYWRGSGKDPGESEANLKELHEFIKINGVFKGDQYLGIGRMLMIEDIFEEKTSLKMDEKLDYRYPWLIPEKHVEKFEKVVNNEYGLNIKLSEKPRPYTVAQFLWNIYKNLDRDGKEGHRESSVHMLEIAELLFKKKFPSNTGLKVTREKSNIHGEYLLVEVEGKYKWPLFFVSGTRLLNNRYIVYDVRSVYKTVEPEKEFPTICGTFFGDNIKEIARQNYIQLLQISSLFKFFQWVEHKRDESITPEVIAPHLFMIPKQDEVPMPVGKATQEIEEKLRPR